MAYPKFSKSYNVILLNRITLCNLVLKSVTNFCKPTNASFMVTRRYCLQHTMKVLNVAEKHDAAKNIAGYLSRGSSRKVNNYIFLYIINFFEMHNFCHTILFNNISYL